MVTLGSRKGKRLGTHAKIANLHQEPPGSATALPEPSHPQSRGLTPQAEKSELALKNTSPLISKIGKTRVNV